MKYFDYIGDRRSAVQNFHNKHMELFNTSVGSGSNHQSWEGGYKDHINQCFDLASRLYDIAKFPFTFESAILVLYFHDIEKLWRGTNVDKEKYYTEILPNEFSIIFTEEELNALKYIHGEGNEYRKDKRIMNELAAFCHSCDVLSARCFHSIKDIVWK